MAIRLSTSSKNKWLQCGHSYFLHYVERYRPITISSPLIFGSSIDQALNYMLERKDDVDVLEKSIQEFNRNFEQGENSVREKVDMPLNPLIRFSKYDFDNDLLGKAEWRELFKYDSKFFETKNKVDEQLKAKVQWLDIDEESRMVYNYANWLCMQKKGSLLLTAYFNNILPLIKSVLAVQMTVELPDNDGNVLNGVIDAVVELHDGTIAVMDNKTSSSEYDENSVAGSEQLATYQAILNAFHSDPEHPWNHKIEKCVYAVMSKKLIKDVTKVCKECGHVATGSHKTCDNHIDDERCNGSWDKTVKFDVKTQFIVGTISEEYAESVLENAATVKSCIEKGLFPKNFSACSSMFGSECPFISKCHGGSNKGLVKLEEKK